MPKKKVRRLVVVDKDAFVKEQFKVVDAIVAICDTLAVTEELLVHYKNDARLFPPILRALSKLGARGKYILPEVGSLGELPKKFRKAFNNEDDEYLIRAARDLKAGALITCDNRVKNSSSNTTCGEFYAAHKWNLEIVDGEAYGKSAPPGTG